MGREVTLPRGVRTIGYSGFSSESPGEVAYAIFGKRCVFTGTIIQATSTINCAEEIISIIARRERLDPKTLIFFDLQTHLGYVSKKPNEFEFDQLSVEWNGPMPYVNSWTRVRCPARVVWLFRSYIGPKPRQKGLPQNEG